MKKRYIVKMTDKRNGAYIFSQTNKPKQRQLRLTKDITNPDSAKALQYGRYEPFIGSTKDDLDFEVYVKI